MMLRCARVLGSLVAGVLLGACSASDSTIFEPLVGAAPIAVSLQSGDDVPLSGLPRLTISATAAEVNVLWEVESGSCVIASASAARAGAVIEIKLERGGNPLANCVAARVGYRYLARVAGLEQGRYEVRVVDVFGGQPPYEVGRRSVVVGAVIVVD
jgi:hypothetical protein